METTHLNPAKGIRLIRTANVLTVIATCLSVISIGVVFMGLGVGLEGALESLESISPVAAIGALVGSLGAVGGLIIFLISGIMQIVGLTKTSAAHSGYKTALILVVASIAVSFIPVLVPIEGLNTIFSVISPVIDALVICFIISATASLLSDKGNTALAEKGTKVRNIVLICAAISLVAELLAFVPALGNILTLAVSIASIIQLVALFKYIGFLGASAKSLKA